MLSSQGNYADAISCYNEVLRIDPLAADGLVNRGNTYKEIGRVSEAIQDYIHAISVRPTMAEAHANLASAYKDRYAYLFFLLLLLLLLLMYSIADKATKHESF